MVFQVGQSFGDYSIIAALGPSGAGEVYKVEHRLTKRIEAMKVLSAEFATDVQIKRFEREMRALARLSHPNIAALHNAMHAQNRLILLMEYIEGETLETMFREERVPFATGIGYIRQILAALGYAHQQGVVHRDVTPAKVIVTRGGDAKLTDFGLSKSYGDPLVTSCGEVVGSLPYLAPEQLKGATHPNRRSDLYSVGAILYQHLTGQKPFGEDRKLAAVLADSEAEPRPPSQIEPKLAAQWDEIMRRALARDPGHRYPSAEEFLKAITQLDQSATPADLPLPQLRRIGWVTAIFAGLVLAALASPSLSLLHAPPPPAWPFERLHIAPPDFATEKPPAPAIIQPAATQESADHIEGAVQPAETEEPAADSPEAASASEPSVAAETEPPAPPEVTPAKRKFWSKLNVFKKHNTEAKDKPQLGSQ